MKINREKLLCTVLLVGAQIAANTASADWVGKILSERPAGQAYAAGIATDDGFLFNPNFPHTYPSTDRFEMSGNGAITVTIYSPEGVLIADETLVGPNLYIGFFPNLVKDPPGQDLNWAYAHSIVIRENETQILHLIDTPVGTQATFTMTGTFGLVPNNQVNLQSYTSITGRSTYKFYADSNCTYYTGAPFPGGTVTCR